MIKYLGSKRRLLPLLVPLATSTGARSALDLFSGTARVARAMRQAGLRVTAVDSATYAHVLAVTYVATDSERLESAGLQRAIAGLNGLPGKAGYVTEVFCERARYFHPDNGRRIDAIRESIESDWRGSPWYPILLASLMEAADRVDSTTGVQMAYLKKWAPRALKPLELRVPALVGGPPGTAVRGDATVAAGELGHFDVAYLDPPYNQHRYLANYHVWETLVRWDAPGHYGVACKRKDLADARTVSPFNRRREMPVALEATLAALDAELVLVSYNDESWLSAGELVEMCRRTCRAERASVAVVGVDHPRYIGARIGIHNRDGVKVGTVKCVRNTELVVVAGTEAAVEAAVAAGLAGAAASGLAARRVPAEGSPAAAGSPAAEGSPAAGGSPAVEASRSHPPPRAGGRSPSQT